jgi:hypothetical protein
MKTLSSIWFADKFDLEYNQYVLLDYLQRAENDFKNFKIDSYLFDVRFHCKNLECFLTTRTFMEAKDRPIKDTRAERFRKLMKLPDDDEREGGEDRDGGEGVDARRVRECRDEREEKSAGESGEAGTGDRSELPERGKRVSPTRDEGEAEEGGGGPGRLGARP